MATDIVYLTGKCNWAKVYKPEAEYDKSKHSWRIDLYPDDQSWELFDKAGLALKKREDKEGGKFVSFKRPTKKIIKDKIVELEPPKVLDFEGNPMTDLIGNGSDVTIKVSVYDTAKGKGHTLEAVKVNELVEFGKSEIMVAEGVEPF